ncbi:MAG TPA: gas vesicle protein [Longimicrobiales bacterium]|nr:gas vesicle protein [Longimicrobiales bacterium]
MHPTERYAPEDQLTLAELVNRVLDRGALIAGDVVISVAGIDLIYVSLQVAIAAMETAQRAHLPAER